MSCSKCNNSSTSSYTSSSSNCSNCCDPCGYGNPAKEVRVGKQLNSISTAACTDLDTVLEKVDELLLSISESITTETIDVDCDSLSTCLNSTLEGLVYSCLNPPATFKIDAVVQHIINHIESNILEFDSTDFTTTINACSKAISINTASLKTDIVTLLLADNDFITNVSNLITYTVFPDVACPKNFLADMFVEGEGIALEKACFPLTKYTYELQAAEIDGEFTGLIGINGMRYTPETDIPFTDTAAIITWLQDVARVQNATAAYSFPNLTITFDTYGDTTDNRPQLAYENSNIEAIVDSTIEAVMDANDICCGISVSVSADFGSDQKSCVTGAYFDGKELVIQQSNCADARINLGTLTFNTDFRNEGAGLEVFKDTDSSGRVFRRLQSTDGSVTLTYESDGSIDFQVDMDRCETDVIGLKEIDVDIVEYQFITYNYTTSLQGSLVSSEVTGFTFNGRTYNPPAPIVVTDVLGVLTWLQSLGVGNFTYSNANNDTVNVDIISTFTGYGTNDNSNFPDLIAHLIVDGVEVDPLMTVDVGEDPCPKFVVKNTEPAWTSLEVFAPTAGTTVSTINYREFAQQNGWVKVEVMGGTVIYTGIQDITVSSVYEQLAFSLPRTHDQMSIAIGARLTHYDEVSLTETFANNTAASATLAPLRAYLNASSSSEFKLFLERMEYASGNADAVTPIPINDAPAGNSTVSIAFEIPTFTYYYCLDC
jgi:hypothetical protein